MNRRPFTKKHASERDKEFPDLRPGDAALDAVRGLRAFMNRISGAEAADKDDFAMEHAVASFEEIKDFQDRFFAKGADAAASAMPSVAEAEEVERLRSRDDVPPDAAAVLNSPELRLQLLGRLADNAAHDDHDCDLVRMLAGLDELNCAKEFVAMTAR